MFLEGILEDTRGAQHELVWFDVCVSARLLVSEQRKGWSCYVALGGDIPGKS